MNTPSTAFLSPTHPCPHHSPQVLDPATTCSLLSTYGRLDDLRAYAARRGDHEAVLDLLLARPGGAQQALAVLRQPSAGPELAYKCAPALVAQVGAGGVVAPNTCLTGDSMSTMGGNSLGGVCCMVAPGCRHGWGTAFMEQDVCSDDVLAAHWLHMGGTWVAHGWYMGGTWVVHGWYMGGRHQS
jgi:hypothetical protein